MIYGAGELLWHDGQCLAMSLPLHPVNGNLPRDIKYVLGLTQLEEIEALRDGCDARFDLRITLIMSADANVNLPKRGVDSAISRCIIKIQSFQIDLFVNIPKSRYEENLLPHMGLNGLAFLTITFPPGTRRMFSAALYELQRAEATLRTAVTEEQFESVVLQCRNAVDALLNQFHLELPKRGDGKPDASFGARVDAWAEQCLRSVLSDSQVQSVRKILKAVWQPYSGATKPGPAHHSRAFATFALQQAASVVKLASEILWSKERE